MLGYSSGTSLLKFHIFAFNTDRVLIRNGTQGEGFGSVMSNIAITSSVHLIAAENSERHGAPLGVPL